MRKGGLILRDLNKWTYPFMPSCFIGHINSQVNVDFERKVKCDTKSTICLAMQSPMKNLKIL